MSDVTSHFSLLILLNWFFSFFLHESGERFFNFVYLLKEPGFCFINLYYCFFHFFFIYFCLDLYDFFPSTNFGFFFGSSFSSCFRCKVRLSIRCFSCFLWLDCIVFSSVQFSSVTQSCPTLCEPMNCSTPGLPVHHHLPEFTQIHVHRVCDAIQPSHPRFSPSSPAPNPSQHQSLSQWVNSSHEVAKVLELQPQRHSFQRNPRVDLLQNGLVGSPCSPRDSILL